MNKAPAILGVLALLASAPAFAQQSASARATSQASSGETTPKQAEGREGGPDTAAEHADSEDHGMFAGLLWPTVNFAILVGGLWWFLKDPLASYLRDRHGSIRKELVEAAGVKAAAAAQLAEIDRKLHALPGEIDALRKRGVEEIASEEQRIGAMATAERERLLEQTRREIAVQLRFAKRELVEHTANLAVQLAGDRLQQQITPDDQNRLVDRYLDQVKEPERAEGAH